MSTSPTGKPPIGREARIAASVAIWQRFRERQQHHFGTQRLPFVTISRQYGCEALPLADRLVEILNERFHPPVPWASYDREVLDLVADDLHISRHELAAVDGCRRDALSEFFDSILNRKLDEAVMFRKIAGVIRSLACRGHTVLVGRGSYLITQGLQTGLHVRLIAPRQWRIENIATKKNLSFKEAERDVLQGEAQRDAFIRTFFLGEPPNPFHLILENSLLTVPQMAEIIVTALQARFGPHHATG
ncbi:MAG: cytidylate kinase-like family protein [Verrucomicrobiae bacterium]|nr:cytidylate kinase-like family protein [Verrucomicrobiae bacterium]